MRTLLDTDMQKIPVVYYADYLDGKFGSNATI